MDITNIHQQWYKFNTNPTYRTTLLALGVLWLAISILVGHLSLISIIAFIALIISIKFYYESWTAFTVIVAAIAYALTNGIILVVILLILIFYFYKLLEKHRINRLKKIASMSPQQISGVTYQHPEVEIVIRGDRK